MSRLYRSDIILSSRFLLLEELVDSSPSFVLSFLFHFHQFLSNFLKYSPSNFPWFHLYNIFAVYFSRSSPLLKYFSSAQSNFSCLLTSAFTLFLNCTTNSFVFSKSSFFFQLLCLAINLFYWTKYFVTPLTYLLFNIFPTSYSLTPSTVISFTSSLFYSPTWSLYCAIQLTFTTGWIFIDVGSCNLITLVDTTSSMVYGPINWSTNFFAGLFLNTKSFVLNITLSPTFHTSVFFLPLSACLFIFSYAFINATSVSSSQMVDLVFLYFTFHFYFHSVLFLYFSFLEQLGLGLIGHAVTSVTTW